MLAIMSDVKHSWSLRLFVHVAAVMLALSGLTLMSAPQVHAAPTVDATYHQQGPLKVSKRMGSDCCSSTGDRYDIWYPSNLGANGGHHPIITWGDGTFAHPYQYDYLLSHLASWGFVVIAPDQTNTGTGAQMVDAAKYLVRQNSDRKSIFYGRLDTHSIGAIGHSQGAMGSLNALANSHGLIKTAVTVEMPSPGICQGLGVAVPGLSCKVPTRIPSGSVLLIGGSSDPVTDQPTVHAYYDSLPPSIAKARAMLVGATHNDIQGQPGCTNFPCTAGVDGYLGYLTAWFMDQLSGNARAHTAFVARTGELAHNPQWTDQASNITR